MAHPCCLFHWWHAALTGTPSLSQKESKKEKKDKKDKKEKKEKKKDKKDKNKE